MGHAEHMLDTHTQTQLPICIKDPNVFKEFFLFLKQAYWII